MNFPEKITVQFKRHPDTGLIAAGSDDLVALFVVGRTLEDVERQIAPSVVAIIKEQFGIEVQAVRECDLDDGGGDFIPLPHECDWALSSNQHAYA